MSLGIILLESDIEEEGNGVVTSEIDNTNGNDGSSSIPVGNKSGRAGPGRRLEINLEEDIIREIVDTSSMLVDGGNSIIIAFSI